ncbi:response regulator [Sphingomonas sp. CGMCC 1.13654]|uniref:Response regulator n=1 Tax=Sphingomonas chungangi TaxID=2683589 RepID=A0A838LEI0_9SPHN|nr:response regulator [Sphingomonas chungangi]MBA2936536.1 response regulator [Sphingomonas chungangi]MVW55921.1 response regulator [Sphingomonas chungangi]
MPSSRRHKAIVLVVEDEPILRMMAVDIVEEGGFEAIEASDANEAIAILEARHDIRLVFTDVDMPGGMDGLKLAAAIRDRWPPIEVIVTSGKALPEGIDLPARVIFIPKPFDMKRLKSALQQMAA